MPDGTATAVRPSASRPTRAELPNGMVLILHESHANPTVAIHGLVRAGAIFDPSAKSGLAGFTAAMLDRGTTRRTAFEQAEALESLGASLHYDSGPETVTFSGNLLSEDLPAVLDVLADALRNPVFTAEQVEKARDELLTRVKISGENTGYVASRAANEMLYPADHPFHRPAIGAEGTLSAVTREDLASFHGTHYGPAETALVLAGDVDPEAVLDEVRRAFGDWRRLDRPAAFRVPPAPAPAKPQRRVVEMKGKSQVDVVVALPGIARTEPRYYAAMIANFVLGGGSLSSRLMDSIRDKQGLVYGVYSNLNAGVGAGPIQIRAGTNPLNAERTAEAILAEVSRMHEEGPDAHELEEAVSYLTGIFPVRLETNAGVAAQVLGAELYGLGVDYIERYPSIIRGVTLQQTKDAARAVLMPQSHALAIAGSTTP